MKKFILVLLVVPLLFGYKTNESNPHLIVKSNVSDYDELYFSTNDVKFLTVTNDSIINTSNKLVKGYLNNNLMVYFEPYSLGYFYLNGVETEENKVHYIVNEIIENKLEHDYISANKDKIYIAISIGFLMISMFRFLGNRKRVIK